MFEIAETASRENQRDYEAEKKQSKIGEAGELGEHDSPQALPFIFAHHQRTPTRRKRQS
jgi:hypothetical protein